MTTTNTKMPNSADAYAFRRDKAVELMDRLMAAIEVHGTRAAAQPCNWGYVGDMARLEIALAKALALVSD